MGNRALIIFTDKDRSEFSPVVYLHWHGAMASDWIEMLKKLMDDRKDDVQYAAARFVGIAHEQIDGNFSLGIWNSPPDAKEWDKARWKEYSHGGHGVFIVDVSDFSYVQHT